MLKVKFDLGDHTVTYTEDDTDDNQSFAELVREVTYNDCEAVKQSAHQLYGLPPHLTEVKDIMLMEESL